MQRITKFERLVEKKIFMLKIINRKVKEEWTASENYSDPYGHFASTGEKVLEGFYLKLVQSKNARKKK